MTRLHHPRHRPWGTVAAATLLALGFTGALTRPAAAVVLAPHITKAFGDVAIPLNGTTSLQFTISNPNLGISLSSIGFTDPFPAGLTLVSTTFDNGCGGTLSTTASSVSLSGGSIGPGDICLISGLTVKGTTLGTKVNSVTVGWGSGTGNTSQTSVVVDSPPATAAAFTISSTTQPWVAPNVPTTLEIKIHNANTDSALTSVGFSSTLPPGVAIANPNALSATGGCTSGEVSAGPGTHAVTLTGASLAHSSGDPLNPLPGETCLIDVNVVSVFEGFLSWSTGPVSSTEGGSGTGATATLAVIGRGPRIYWGNDGGTATGGTIAFGRLSATVGVTMSQSTGSGSPTGTAIDAAAGRVYWIDYSHQTIRWAALDNAAHGTVRTTGASVSNPEGLAINPATHRLFWTNYFDDTIDYADIGNATAGVLYSSASPGGLTLDAPSSLTVDPGHNRIYWTNTGATHPGIAYANLDGSGSGGVLNTNGGTVATPVGLAIDEADGLVYWANAAGDKISYAHLDGSGAADLPIFSAFISAPYGIAYDSIAGFAWWGNHTADMLSYGAAGAASGTVVPAGATVSNTTFPALLYPPQSISAPSLTGSGKPGVQLTCGKGGWAPDLLGAFLYRVPQSFAYAWQRNGAAIAGATASTYTPSTTGDYTCTVTASNAAGPTTSAPSAVADSLLPTVGVPTAAPSNGSAIGTSVPIKVTWSGSDAGSGIAHYEIWLSTNGGTYLKLSSPTSATYTRSLTASSTTTYRFRVRAFDKAGNVSAFAYGATFHVKLVQQTSTSLRWAGSWTSATTTSASGGSYRYASVAGASVSYTFTGRAIGVVATKGTAFGSFSVYLDGVLVGTVSDYSSSTLYRRLVYSKAWTSSATHTIKLVCAGTTGHPRIDLDAFVVLA